MASRIFGSAIKRREDPRLITGQAKYTDDFVLPGMAHMAVVRSPYAHASIKAIRTKKAAGDGRRPRRLHRQGHEGRRLRPDPLRLGRAGLRHKTPPIRRSRSTSVRYVGNAVAIVVATDRYLRARRGRRRRGGLRAAAGRRRRREGRRSQGPAAAPRRRPEQRLLPLEGQRAATSRRRSRPPTSSSRNASSTSA